MSFNYDENYAQQFGTNYAPYHEHPTGTVYYQVPMGPATDPGMYQPVYDGTVYQQNPGMQQPYYAPQQTIPLSYEGQERRGSSRQYWNSNLGRSVHSGANFNIDQPPPNYRTNVTSSASYQTASTKSSVIDSAGKDKKNDFSQNSKDNIDLKQGNVDNKPFDTRKFKSSSNAKRDKNHDNNRGYRNYGGKSQQPAIHHDAPPPTDRSIHHDAPPPTDRSIHHDAPPPTDRSIHHDAPPPTDRSEPLLDDSQIATGVKNDHEKSSVDKGYDRRRQSQDVRRSKPSDRSREKNYYGQGRNEPFNEGRFNTGYREFKGSDSRYREDRGSDTRSRSDRGLENVNLRGVHNRPGARFINQGERIQGNRYQPPNSFGYKNERHDPKEDTNNATHASDAEKPKGNNPSTYRSKRIQSILSGKVDESQRGVLIEQLTLGQYECMVCCEVVKCETAIWHCGSCYHVFHLHCIKKWARSPNSLIEGEEGWRCPACQNVTEKIPNQYRCFCSKVRDPEWDRYETPHSCGEVCGKRRGNNCPHTCTILCHPGPCPLCGGTKNLPCDCGKAKKVVKCGQAFTFKCDNKCDKPLSCGRHTCQVVCHSGSCVPCEEKVIQKCYGNHEERAVICGCEESYNESYQCANVCDGLLKCGNHRCLRPCHEGPCLPCKLLPSSVIHCPCGRTSLAEMTDNKRTLCTDLIPTCSNICEKNFTCGSQESLHKCQQPCHEGLCGECQDVTMVTCRCEALEKEFPCSEMKSITAERPFLCDKRCHKKRACGRHKCGQTCCIKPAHPCDQICNQKLSCGLHKCEEPCHRGNCPPCLMASFEELYCHCGVEVLYPPVPCGTLPPDCRQPCSRHHPCGHKVNHTCHSDERCPPCAVLTEKWCMGKHEKRKNIPCHRKEVSCGLPCNKQLSCEQHKCLKICHSGPCSEEDEGCIQSCPGVRPECGHPCGAPCHVGKDCPKTACKAQVTIKCPCGIRKAKVLCEQGGKSSDITEYQKITLQTMSSSQDVDLSHFSGAKKSASRQLECDRDCALLERNRRVALALEIRNPDLSSKLGPPAYSTFLKDFAKQNQQHVSSVEKTLSELVQTAKESKQVARSHGFPPSNRNHRQLIHELAEFYGCDTQSYDAEPMKNVVVTAFRERSWLPSVSLTTLIQRELHPKPPLPVSHENLGSQGVKQGNLVVLRAAPKPDKPVIDYFDMTS